uniref:Rei n=1 Tax=synthetic construct TaxID=32630 RepID=UPI001AD95113|nr:Chain A, Rei [synthetic construct]
GDEAEKQAERALELVRKSPDLLKKLLEAMAEELKRQGKSPDEIQKAKDEVKTKVEQAIREWKQGNEEQARKDMRKVLKSPAFKQAVKVMEEQEPNNPEVQELKKAMEEAERGSLEHHHHHH